VRDFVIALLFACAGALTAQSLAITGTLPAAKDFSEAYYPEESHLFVRDESLSDAFRRAADFFDKNLAAGQRP
jgi:hypothetical protein